MRGSNDVLHTSIRFLFNSNGRRNNTTSNKGYVMEIECKGIGNLSISSSDKIIVDLEEVDMSFLEDVEISDIVSWCDTEKLLEQMDTDELFKELLEDENNQEALHEHLRASGYIFNKA